MTWPSTFDPGTLGYMKDRIADELMRGDLTSQIAVAIDDAIDIYQKKKFRFNETFTTHFTTVVGQQNYNEDNTQFSDVNFPNIPNPSPRQFYQIEHLLITVPPAVFHMHKMQPFEILQLTQTGTQMGQPYNWAIDNETIMLYPIPSSGGPGQINSFSFTNGLNYTTGVYTNSPLINGSGTGATANITVAAGSIIAVQIVNPGTRYQVGDILTSAVLGPGIGFTLTVSSIFTGPTGPYLMTVIGHLKYPGPATDAEVDNRWMVDAERLIRSRAKFNIAQHVTRNMTMAQMMSPDEPTGGGIAGATWEAMRELTAERVRMTERGVIRPMYF